MTRGYIKTAGDGDGDQASLAKDDYEVKIVEARPGGEISDEGAFTLFIDLEVQSGPDKGAVTGVSLWFPPESNRKAQFYFKKKARGFAAAFAEVDEDLEEGSEEERDAIVEALEEFGKPFVASLGIQQKGSYKGSQELLATRPAGEDAEDEPEEEEEGEEPEDEEPKKPARRSRAKKDEEEEEEEPKKPARSARSKEKDKVAF